MITRKPTQAEEIQLLQNEIHRKKEILGGILRKYNFAETGWPQEDKEVATECTKFINRNMREVRAFFRPATEI